MEKDSLKELGIMLFLEIPTEKFKFKMIKKLE